MFGYPLTRSEHRRRMMNMLKIVVLLTLIVAGMSGAYAATLAANSATTADGTVAYSVTYTGTAPTATMTGDGITTGSGFVSGHVTGVDVSGADTFTADMTATGNAADHANAHAAVTSAVGDANVAVANYAIYGYATPNFAYASQYADSIKGETVDLTTHANNPGAVKFGTADSEISGTTTASKKLVAVTNLGQDAMAGGANDPNTGLGLYAMSDIYTGTKIAGLTSTVTDYNIFMDNDALFQLDATGTLIQTGKLADNSVQLLPGGINPSIKVNSPALAFASKSIAYTNLDTAMQGNGALPYLTTDTDRVTAAGHVIDRVIDSHNDALQGGLPQNVYLYSLINLNDASAQYGKVDAVFY